MAETDDDDGRLSYTASLVSQGRHRFYSLTIPSDVLARTSFVITRDEDPSEGFQRLLSRERAQEIADYIDAGLGTIPTSIVLSAQEAANLRYDQRKRTLSFSDEKRSFLILDGQHRVYGFSIARSALRVPVIIYNELSRVDESRLFIDINVKQKAVPNELLLDIRKLADYQNDVETRLGDIFDMFNNDPGSPLAGMMSPAQRKKDLVSRVTFNSAVKPLLSLFSNHDNIQVYSILAAYIYSVQVASSAREWQLNIVNPTVFKALMIVFPDIAERVKDRFHAQYTTDNFLMVVEEIFSRVKSSSLKTISVGPTAYAKIFQDAMKARFTL